MRRDQRSADLDEALGRAIGPEALTTEASAFTQQKQLISEKLGIA
jgi:hypothetical protein